MVALGAGGTQPCAEAHTVAAQTRTGGARERTRLFAEVAKEDASKVAGVSDKLVVWMDCEMTGLRLDSDKLIEVAALVTDSDLNILGDGVDIVIHADDEALAAMPPVVADMHERSGLTEEVRRSTVTLAEAEQQVLDYIRAYAPTAGTVPLAGNSIATDRGFIARDMPALDSHLHYRMIDVSSIKELCRRWYPRIYFGQPEKGLTHRALADIKESIRELEYYRRTAFVAPPGPSSTEIATVAAELSGTAKPAGTVPRNGALEAD
ncbi:oligoribonuclease [Nocardia amikacinitolerans]|nr:oligoribonuclease [Nocardia amikacinitolerans]